MVTIAVIGAGHWGPNLIRNFQNPPASRVAWVVDRDPQRLQQVQMRFPEVRVDEQAEAAFGDPSVDAVVIATPTATHFQLAAAALDAGKHVLIEKPIATRTADAEELQRRAAARGLILMVGHVFVFNGAIRWIKDYLDRGELGPLYYISMVRTNLGPIRMDVNAAWDLAAHDVSILNYWLGGEPAWVSARTGCWINPGIADVMFATLGYADSRLAHIHVSWLNPKKAREISVAGARRMLTFDDMNLAEPIRVYDKQVTDARTTPAYVDTFASFRASVRDGDITIPRVAGGEPLRRECDHFLECVMHHRTPETDAASGRSVVRVLEAMDRSAANGGASETLR